MGRRLYEAAVGGSVSSLLELLQEDGLILDRVMVSCFSESPLHVAAMLGHMDFVKELLRRKPELAAELDSRGFSPLHLASAKGYVHIVKELLRVNPDMCYVRDHGGRNPVHLAAIKGRVDAVRELVQARPQAARATVDRHETILHLCVKHGQLETLKLLVEIVNDHGFVNARDDDGFTILHVAVANKQIEVISYLLANTRVEVNAVNANGFTALDILAQSCRDIYEKDMDIREALHDAAAIRVADSDSTYVRTNLYGGVDIRVPVIDGQHFTPRPSQGHSLQKNSDQKDWMTRKQSALMVVASLIATMAFQSGVNPPGGVWQDDLKTVGTQGKPPHVAPTMAFQSGVNPPGGVWQEDLKTVGTQGEAPHVAGAAVMASKHKDAYHVYLVGNTIGFISSLSIILLLITGIPFLKRFLMWVLTVIMWVAITSIALTYGLSLAVITPEEENETVTLINNYTLVTWAGVMALLFVGHTIRLVALCVKRLFRIIWRKRRLN